MAIVRAEYNLKLKVVDAPDVGIDGVANQQLVFETDTDVTGSLNGTTTPAATMQWQDTRTLSAGADTIDLTALTEGNLSTVKNFTGLRLRFVKIVASASNTAALIVQDAVSNGYPVFGSAAGRVDIPIAGAVLFYAASGGSAVVVVSATAKDISVSSSDTDAQYEVQIVVG